MYESITLTFVSPQTTDIVLGENNGDLNYFENTDIYGAGVCAKDRKREPFDGIHAGLQALAADFDNDGMLRPRLSIDML